MPLFKPAYMSDLSISNDNYKFIIDLTTPCSTAPSTPTVEEFGLDSAFEDEYVCTSEATTESDSSPPTVVGPDPFSSACRTNMFQSIVFGGEHAILAYLHSNATTLDNVEALIPTQNHNRKVMNKLGMNIGRYYSFGRTSENEVEQILLHILAKGDCYNYTFERTKAQIERFKYETYYTNFCKQRRQLNKHAKAEAPAKKAERDAEHRRKIISETYKQLVPPGYLPISCTSLADITTGVYGMSWTEAPKTPKEEKIPKKRKGTTKSPKANYSTSPSARVESGFWSRTRLHNGPGLTDRKKPKVRIPQADARRVLTTPRDLGVEKEEKKREHLWAKTKSTPDFLFSKGKGKKSVVKMPS